MGVTKESPVEKEKADDHANDDAFRMEIARRGEALSQYTQPPSKMKRVESAGKNSLLYVAKDSSPPVIHDPSMTVKQRNQGQSMLKDPPGGMGPSRSITDGVSTRRTKSGSSLLDATPFRSSLRMPHRTRSLRSEKDVASVVTNDGTKLSTVAPSSRGVSIGSNSAPGAVSVTGTIRPQLFVASLLQPSGEDLQQSQGGEVDSLLPSGAGEATEERDGFVMAETVDEEAMAAEFLRTKSQIIRNQIIDEAVVATHVKKDEGRSRNRISIILCCVVLVVAVGVVLGIILPRRDYSSSSDTEAPSEAPTNVPTWSEFEELVQLLSAVTSRELLLDDSSAQNQALLWLFGEDLYQSEDPVVLTNRYVLALLYFATDGENWFNPLGFLENTSACEWPPAREGETESANGIRCNGKGELVLIRLDSNNLNGTLPEELSTRTSLEVLSASGNALEGTIPPSFGELESLQVLDLADNNITGPLPDTIARLTNLRDLVLYDNDLTGTIPSGVTWIEDLETLRIHENNFVGTIPEFLNRSGLMTLLLRDNYLSGTIPSSIFTLSALVRLTLSNNKLNGTISSDIGDLVKLTSLALYENALTGSIPSDIRFLTQLEYLGLHDNPINGTIPPELGGLAQLPSVILSDMELSGTIPSSLAGLTSAVQLFLNGNNLTGEFPSEIGQVESLRSGVLHLANNSLIGSLNDVWCKNGTSPPSFLLADCDEIECSCCTHCCSDATGECTVELNQICLRLEDTYETLNEDDGAECVCSEDGSVLSCADTCELCNLDGSICFETYDYGYNLPENGTDNMWRCNMRYTNGREGNISYVFDEMTYECEFGLDGIPCSSCEVSICGDGFYGPRIDCSNVQEDAIMDVCDPSTDGADWLPLAELLSNPSGCSSCLYFGG